MNQWIHQTFFYHIFPLGLCGAPPVNDFISEPYPRITSLSGWLEHIQWLGANAILLGPVFESSSHGYDTADLTTVDRRLGRNADLTQFSRDLHAAGMRLVLDGVFNHVGRNFWAFRDVQQNGEKSHYRDWFAGLRFDRRSSFQDRFGYDGWNGHYSLVKLNLVNSEVREYLFQAVARWVEEFQIDGLRLDAADCLDTGFIRELAAFCRKLKPDFWLMGEIIHGDYRRWAGKEMLDSVTNYEAYKGLYSSLVDRNYYEIACTLNRQYGTEGLYKDLLLYNFADNHDVNRVASSLGQDRLLYPLYLLLFTMPGVPSVYYGSEWGIAAKKIQENDWPLRPSLDLRVLIEKPSQPDLPSAVRRLSRLRQSLPGLQRGGYRELMVSHQLLVFERTHPQAVIVAVNSSDRDIALNPACLAGKGLEWFDVLNSEPFLPYQPAGGGVIPPGWGRVLVQK